MTQYIKIGQIINTFGHRGEMKVYPLTDDINRFYELREVYIEKQGVYREFHVSKVRLHQSLAILSLEEIADMNGAETLKGSYLELPESRLRPLPDGHYYIFQLVGLDVLDGEHHLGKLTDVLKTGSNDVYVVTDAQGHAIYIPALKEVVKKIDLSSGIMEVVLPPGLVD